MNGNVVDERKAIFAHPSGKVGLVKFTGTTQEALGLYEAV
jgi:hypothetical protein